MVSGRTFCEAQMDPQNVLEQSTQWYLSRNIPTKHVFLGPSKPNRGN